MARQGTKIQLKVRGFTGNQTTRNFCPYCRRLRQDMPYRNRYHPCRWCEAKFPDNWFLMRGNFLYWLMRAEEDYI